MENAAAILQRYPVTPQHPPLRVRVHVQWNGRMYKAARVFHPRRKVLCWLTVRASDGSDQYLPPKSKLAAGSWAPDPEWWAPERPELWKAPLPPPLAFNGVIADEVRMVDAGPGARRRQRAAAASADELKHKLPWWWLVDGDAPRMEYLAAGLITRQMAEGRLMRAVSSAGVGDMQRFRRQLAIALPAFADLPQHIQAAMREESEREQVLPPSAWQARLQLGHADHDDWLTAMAWFTALNPPEERAGSTARAWELNNRQKVLIYRARCVGGPMSWRSIGEIVGLHPSRCQQLYDTAIDRALAFANSTGVERNTQMIRLRQRNRASRQGDTA